MSEKTIQFKASAVIINTIVALLFWVLMITSLLKKPNEIRVLIIVFILIIITNGFYNSIRAFLYFVQGKPAISLNQDRLLDNVTNRCLKWEEIKNFNEYSLGRHSFLAIELKNHKEYFAQINNPIKKLIYWFNFKMTGYYLHTNTQFVSLGKKELLNFLLQYRAKAIVENRIQNKKN